jgi:vacuolar-type H+-ATPase subunit E/Vma4
MSAAQVASATEMVTMGTPTSATPQNDGGNTEDIELGLPPPTAPAVAAATAVPNESAMGKGFLKPLPETTWLERIAGFVAMIAIGTAIAAAVIEQSIIVIVGAILSSVIGPYCYYQQTKLTDIRTLQETKNAISEQVNQLTMENKRLIHNINDLTTSIDRLHEIDEALEVLTSTQGQSIETFQKQVQDNKDILQQMKSNVKANVLQNLLSVILRSDVDQDMIMDSNEVDTLIRRIQNISGVTVNETKFRAVIQNQSISAIMEIVKNLLRPNLPESERIFIFPASSPNNNNSSNNTSPKSTATPN